MIAAEGGGGELTWFAAAIALIAWLAACGETGVSSAVAGAVLMAAAGRETGTEGGNAAGGSMLLLFCLASRLLWC